MVHSGIEYIRWYAIDCWSLWRDEDRYRTWQQQNVASICKLEFRTPWIVLDWNHSSILAKKDAITNKGHVVDYILDKTGTKGTDKWAVQEAAEVSVAALTTLSGALIAPYISARKNERVNPSKVVSGALISDLSLPEKDEILYHLSNALNVHRFAVTPKVLRWSKTWTLPRASISTVYTKTTCGLKAVCSFGLTLGIKANIAPADAPRPAFIFWSIPAE